MDTQTNEGAKKISSKDIGNAMTAFYSKKAKEAEKAKKDNKPAPKISVVEKIKVEFTEEVGHIRKGHVQHLSALAYEVYKSKKVVTKMD